MKKIFIGILISLLIISKANADRIYIVNNSGYNYAGTELINAIIANGHVVTVGISIPNGITTSCIDPINGYDMICLFGNSDYSSFLNQIRSFIDCGGKVFYQYEVTCCPNSSIGASFIASSLTGLNIIPNSNASIAGSIYPPGWYTSLQDECISIFGNAYKGLDGIPIANQINAIGIMNNASPLPSVCSNFGFYFSTTDFVGTAHNGAFFGLGDINIFYDGYEPFWNGGTTAVNMDVINFFFPNNNSKCNLFPVGCILGNPSEINPSNNYNNFTVTPNPFNDFINIEFPNLDSQVSRIILYDILGNVIFDITNISNNNYTIGTSEIPQGFYILEIHGQNKRIIRKIIKE
ncbi:MAG: T9SS type A sorting domain-containing protein [Bacteroidetes bacterium]|nr:T9SS type A sorting domain-containing protein [Bacteroidota bacterium]